ncbi:DUF2860 family protein [Vibrio lentus]|nr:DUF2860 family protein [Vibrio lentus]
MSSGVTEANGMVAILGSMQYTFGALNHKQIFLGTSRDDIITKLAMVATGEPRDGYRFSILPTLISGEVWDDLCR